MIFQDPMASLNERAKVDYIVSEGLYNIGGITADNVVSLKGSGICGIAVISAIFAKPDVEEAARSLRARTLEMLQG